MKSLTVARYQIEDSRNSIRNYYIIFISIIAILAFISIRLSDQAKLTSSGLEFATVIFLFVAGLNSFRTSFLFLQSNNVSRRTFFKGAIMGVMPIAFFMSIIDILINRIYNIFVKSPTNFDMFYGTLRDITQGNDLYKWSAANDIGTLFGTFVFQFAVYSMVFILGIFISVLYYRSNKITKVMISVVPAMLLVFSYNIFQLFPISFWNAIGNFIGGASGWNSRNPYIGFLSFFMLSLILSGLSYLLIRRAVVKE
ncbi:MAG TPA: hypothetical protein VFD57_05205 [Clostridia bacterium]|nr:hypothetical protein [Clostridia bacterium]